MKSLMGIFVFASAIYMAYSMCNTCSSETNLACVDKDKFKVCVDGLPQAPAVKCPAGTVCTPTAKVCAPEASVVAPPCTMCNKCNEGGLFACTGYNTFALCLGGPVPVTANYTCLGDLVCNIDSANICVDKNVTGIGSTCPWSPPETTTVSPEPTITTTIDPVTRPQEFCISKGVRGRYEILSDDTCTQYINCFQSGGTWYGNIYYCPLSTYFNTTSQVCGSNRPARCALTDEICD